MDPRLGFLRWSPTGGSGASLPLSHTFAHHHTSHGSVRLHYWPARRARARPSRVLLFFPGNPGIPDYYTYFLTHLHARLPDTHAVLCTSHVGGDPSMPAPERPLDLRQQVDAKVELVSALRASLEAWPREDGDGAEAPILAIGGHSVGAWMACEVAKLVDVPASYLLFPTLGWIANSYNGWTMWPLFHRPVRTLVPYLSPLVRPLLRFLSLPAASSALVSNSTTLRHVLHLAHSEMGTIRAPDESWFRAQAKLDPGDGVHGAWSAGNIDGWVGADGPLVRGWLGEERVLELEGVPHAFCLSEEHSRTVADVLAGWIVAGAKQQAAGQ